jgi:hypothetical protein
MKIFWPLMLSIFTQVTFAQVNTNPGGGPNPYKSISQICPTLGNEIEVFKNVFIDDVKKQKPQIRENEFFSLVEELYIQETIKALPKAGDVSFVKCTNEQIESLKTILGAYKDAIKFDETCKEYFGKTKDIEFLEKYIQLYERK